MAGHRADAGSAKVWYDVDGQRVEVPGWNWYPHRWAGGAFTTDYWQLRRMLPSPPLHPVRVSRNRALACARGAYVSAAGHEPPCVGFGEVALMAFVTRGEKPAPPLVPGLGRRAMQRYGFGFFPIMTVVTNRVAAELYRILLGIPAEVADVRVEQRLDHERFVCRSDGRLVWDLTVRSDGRPSAGDPGFEDWFYAVEDGDLYRVPVGGSGISRSRYGGKAASVVVGDHPLADQVRRLQLSSSWACEFVPDRQLWLAGPPEWLGPAVRTTSPGPAGLAAHGRLVVSPKPEVAFEVDQGLDSLGWEPAAVFTSPGLRSRCSLPGGGRDTPHSSRAEGVRMAERPTRGVFRNGMAYTRHGEGPITLLFVPGGPGNTLPTGVFALMTRRMVRPYVDAGCTVWTVTRRQNMPAGHTIGDMAGDFARLIKEEFAGHIDIYLGISYGGLIGHYLAAEYPDTCSSFVFVGAGHSVSERGRQLDHRLAVELSRGRRSAAGVLVVEDGLSRPGFPSFPWLARLLGPAVGRVAFGQEHPYFRSDVLVEADAELAFDSREILPNIAVPVLLISGDRDDYFPKDIMEETARLIPRGELQLYEGKTHEGAIVDKRLPQDVLEFAHGTRADAATT